MTMRKPTLILAAISLIALGCGRDHDSQADANSANDEANYRYDPSKPDFSFPEGDGSFEFKQASKSLAGIATKVKNEAIKACLSDSTNSQARKDLIQDVILKWIEPMRALSAVPLADTVDVVPYNSSGCDVYIAIGNYSPATTQLGKTPRVNLNKSGWYGSSTVTLHEFGHAFGLLDTYNGRGGSCQPGQPASVMCYAKYDELMDDDIKGIQSVYRSLYPTTNTQK